MLPVTVDDLRLFLHILGATIWVGGQLTFLALVPVLRRLGPDVLRPVARQLTWILWAGFAILVVTGVWNIMAVSPGSQSHAYQTTLAVKLGVVAISGIAAAVHMIVTGPRARAVWGALTGISALAALLLGTVLAG
jgi:putative copper export protein